LNFYKGSAGSLYIPPEVEMALHKKPEKKAPIEEEGPTPKPVKKVPKQVGQKVTSPPQPKVSAQTNIPPPLAEGERYKIKKKDGKGERERQSLEKEEQNYAPITKAVKTEIRPGAVPRHEEHPHGTGYGQQSTGYMYRSQKDMPEGSRSMMSSQASHRQYGSYYQTPSFEETEAQFSDDEAYQQTKPSNIPQQGQFQSQFQHKYPSQAQGQARPQMQQRDQHHMRLQHPSYHPGPQQPHPYPSQTQMGQFPQQRAPVQTKGSMQPQPLTKQGQAMHHMQHHPVEFQPHYSGQTSMQAPIKTRPSPNEPMQFQPLSPQSQMPPHFGSHQMPIEGGAQKTLQGQQTMGQKVPRRELLMQIKQTIENSRNPVSGSEAGAGATRMVEGSNLPDFEYPCNTNMLTIGTRKGSEISDQSNVLVFKPLLTFIKRQLPNSIKMKYQQKIGNPESLSSILGR